MLVATLVVVGLVLSPADAQRRRERTRVRQKLSQNDKIVGQENIPRKLFDESDSKGPNGFERTKFFTEFDWSDPIFTNMSPGARSEWGFKKSRGVTGSPKKAVENKEPDVEDQSGARKVLRTKVLAGKEVVKDSRSDIVGRKRKYPKADDRKLINDRVKTVNRFRQKENNRLPTSERPSYQDERKIGSPLFEQDREEVDPDFVSRESEQADIVYTNKEALDIKEEITRPKPYKYDPPIKKQTIFLPTLMPPIEEVTKQQFQPTIESILEPKIEEYENDKVLNVDFLSEKDEPIENVFIPTQMSTTEKEKVKAISSYPNSYTSSRDAERRSDQTFNMKKIQEKIEATTPDPLPNYPSGGVNSRNDERWKDQKFHVLNSKTEDDTDDIDQTKASSLDSPTTPKFELNQAFMKGRQRSSSTFKPNYYKSQEISIFEYKTLPSGLRNLNEPLDNLSEENTYSKTHIRKQKIRPSFDDNYQEYKHKIFPILPEEENLSAPLENLSKENTYSKTHIRRQKTRPRNPQLTLKEKEKENDISIDEKNEKIEKIEGTKLKGAKGNNYGKTFLHFLKTRDGGKIDYMHLKMADITKQIPISKLKIILEKNGFTPSDIFNKNPKALEVVGKAMKSKSFLNEPEAKVEVEPTEDPYEGLNIKIKEWQPSDNISSKRKEIRIPWTKRPKIGDLRKRYDSEKNPN